MELLLHVIDNSGAAQVKCLKVLNGYKRRYASIGDFVLVSVKNLREKRKQFSRVKKGRFIEAFIVHVKFNTKLYNNGDSLKFNDNAVILLSNQGKLIGTRIFGGVPRTLRKKGSIKSFFNFSRLNKLN